MARNGFGWDKLDTPPSSVTVAAATLPYYGHCLDCFGADRCMFESNFPMDKASMSYHTLWNAFKRVAAAKKLSAADKAAVFAKTAQRVYKLQDDGDSLLLDQILDRSKL